MKINKFITLSFILIGISTNVFGNDNQSTFKIKEDPNGTVCFTPGGDCTDLIVAEIDKAKQTILVQAYSFTSAPIAKALLNAFKRGVKIQIILDKSQETAKYSDTDFFSQMGIPTYIDSAHAIAHNKVIIVDDNTLITGSFNFTKAAQEKNAENLLILHDPTMISLYKKNWQFHLTHSEIYSK